MSKKKIIETTGKEESLEPTTLEQIFGYNEMARYNTMNASEYEARLLEMNRTDLESEARRVGAIIVEDTTRLRNNLAKEFNGYVASLRKPKSTTNKMTKPLSKAAQAILNEGR